MARRLDIDALRALVAIDAHGGVTRAAEFLALSQSAISHKIKRLESVLDCELLARRPGTARFTDAGERLLVYARRLTALHDEAFASLAKTELSGTIRLGMTEDTTVSDIAQILGRFTRRHPAIQVHTRVNQSLTLDAGLAAGNIDLAVMQVFAHAVEPDDIVLRTDSLHWVKSPDLPLVDGAPVPLLTFDRDCFYRRWAESLDQPGIHFNAVMECPSVAGILSALHAGIGVALLNALHVDNRLERIEGVFPEAPDTVYVVRTRPKLRNLAVRALVDDIVDAL
ncbi:MAG: LysR family transcriptional regulator [Pseudomonadota bacterium]